MEQASTTSEAQQHHLAEGKILNFLLAGEYYGLSLFKVKEIIGMMRVTRVPNSPHFVRGVINLRGRVLPVIDLRARFAMETREDTERTCIIVVQSGDDAHHTVTGVIVDEVCEVLDIAGENIVPAPQMGVQVDAEMIQGVGKVGGKVVLLLDSDRVLEFGDGTDRIMRSGHEPIAG